MAKPHNTVGTGFIFGRDNLTNFSFDPSRPYAGCRLCGDVFQGTPVQNEEWRMRHNKKHNDKEHLELARSGLFATPIAAQKLATFGIISFRDLLMDNEVAHALREAPRAPIDDAER